MVKGNSKNLSKALRALDSEAELDASSKKLLKELLDHLAAAEKDGRLTIQNKKDKKTIKENAGQIARILLKISGHELLHKFVEVLGDWMDL